MNPTQRPSNLNLGLIGNGSISALVDEMGDIVWMCAPRFDSPAVFNSLLQHPRSDDAQGIFVFRLENYERSEQFYVENTAILVTRLWDTEGNAVEITDFMPRFYQFGRTFYPVTLVRAFRPLRGAPKIHIRLRPASNWTNKPTDTTFGSNHVRYVLDSGVMRLTTDMSINAVLRERAFVLDRPHALILGPDETLTDSVKSVATRFHELTEDYWRNWVRYLNIPFEWQEAVIRAAITLKLSTYEDTGAIVAAMTTSIPEAPHSTRNWDYRFCWLRDAYFVINALNRLGKTNTMEHYISYLLNLIANVDGHELQPVYSLDGDPQLYEAELAGLPGYRGMRPVRLGNQAFEQRQNDILGSIVLAAAHAFFDRRILHPVNSDSALFRMLELTGERAYEAFDQPDSGPWEFRNTLQVHTYSSVMCWAACDRLARIAHHLGLKDRAILWRQRADEMHAVICQRAWNEKLGSFVESFDGEHLDASLLLMNELGFLNREDPRFAATVNAIEKHLKRGNLIFRYTKEDDFGEPETAFTVCTFWYINALAQLGRISEARELFEQLLSSRNVHGLFSEDISTDGTELWGNFPQTYSMVGLINSAVRLSKPWEEAF